MDSCVSDGDEGLVWITNPRLGVVNKRDRKCSLRGIIERKFGSNQARVNKQELRSWTRATQNERRTLFETNAFRDTTLLFFFLAYDYARDCVGSVLRCVVAAVRKLCRWWLSCLCNCELCSLAPPLTFAFAKISTSGTDVCVRITARPIFIHERVVSRILWDSVKFVIMCHNTLNRQGDVIQCHQSLWIVCTNRLI